MSEDKKVDIKPSITMLSVIQHIRYTPWLALAEYVDNAIQSSQVHIDSLNEIYGGNYKLHVEISMDSAAGTISIRDNSTGISADDFARAMRPGALPPDRSGLSEFGMGLKSASCWFGDKWSVQTKHFESSLERSVEFDVNKIIATNTGVIPFKEIEVAQSKPYTHVLLEDIKKMPKGRTLKKIEDYLGDIYRVFLRDDLLVLRLNNKKLSHSNLAVLEEPYYGNPQGEKKEWKVDIDFTLDSGQRVSGFAAIAKTGSRRKSGFALFRRGRVIQGSGEEGYRPAEIFGGASTFRYLRIFGELHLNDFNVSHTKDSFKWDEGENEFIEKLLFALQKDEQFLKQASGYRVGSIPDDPMFDSKSVDDALKLMSTPNFEKTLSEAINYSGDAPANYSEFIQYECRKYDINFLTPSWRVEVHFNKNINPKDWINFREIESKDTAMGREARIDIFLNHKIMLEYGHPDKEKTETLIKLAITIALTAFALEISEINGSAGFISIFNRILELMAGTEEGTEENGD